jgi:predicted nucleic acid-binding protein
VTDRIVLDAGPLAMISHPRQNREIADWMAARLHEGTEIIVPEIADFEVRRELLRAGKRQGIERLDQLKTQLTYLPLETATMLRAAEFWARARNQGQPTADPKELDCDVILAAQAERAGAIVATENVGHLSLFVEAKDWRTIS